MEVTRVINGMKEAYELREMGDIEYFLGIRVIRDREERKLCLSHNIYIKKITGKFDLINGICPLIPIPALELLPYQGTALRAQIKEY